MKKSSFFVYMCIIAGFAAATAANYYSIKSSLEEGLPEAPALTKENLSPATQDRLVALQLDAKANVAARHRETSYLGYDDILPWTQRAVIEAMTYTHDDYETAWTAASRHFTAQGWKGFVDAMIRSRTLDFVRAQKKNVEAVAGDFAQADIRYPDNSEKRGAEWVVRVPVMLAFAAADGTRAEYRQLVTVAVMRSDEPQNRESGLGIRQWIAVPAD